MGLKRIQNGKGERGNLEISLSVNPTHAYVSSLHHLLSIVESTTTLKTAWSARTDWVYEGGGSERCRGECGNYERGGFGTERQADLVITASSKLLSEKNR